MVIVLFPISEKNVFLSGTKFIITISQHNETIPNKSLMSIPFILLIWYMEYPSFRCHISTGINSLYATKYEKTKRAANITNIIGFHILRIFSMCFSSRENPIIKNTRKEHIRPRASSSPREEKHPDMKSIAALIKIIPGILDKSFIRNL